MAINSMEIREGTRLRRKGEVAVLVVTGNPRDGLWLHVRRADDPAAEEELCFVEEIAELLPPDGEGSRA